MGSDELKNIYEDNGLLWGMMYLKEHFRQEGSWFHLKVFLESCKNRWLAIHAPRGSAKSTVLCLLKPSHAVCFKQKRFIVIVQNTFAKASRSLENIKIELRDNALIKKDFGIEVTKDAEGDSIFMHPDGFSTRVLCKGADQIGSIRGEKYGAYRPDLILVDDVEDDEMVKSPERRATLMELFNEALMPAGDFKTCQVLVIGTVLHDDSMLAHLISPSEYKEFRKLHFKARYNDNGRVVSLWDARWTVDELDEMERDKPQMFAKEMQGDPSSGLSAYFHKEDFRYWDIIEGSAVLYGFSGEVVSRWKLTDCKAAVAGDLAWDTKRESDFSVLLPGLLTPSSDILIDSYICKKGLRPAEFIETVFMLKKKYEDMTSTVIPFGFEKAKLEKVMKHLLEKEERVRNEFVMKKDLQWDTDKIQRIITRLQARYASHVIYHRRGMGELESQLLRVPNGTHDDLPDAEQGLVQLLVYPKQVVETVKKEDKFEWWRKQTPRWRDSHKDNYVFGRGNRPSVIPTKQACI